MTIDENSTLVEVLQDVGDAVREKGVSGEWKGYQLPSAVRSIRNDPVYDSRVTIQVNGVANGSFTVNQSSDSTIDLQTITMD